MFLHCKSHKGTFCMQEHILHNQHTPQATFLFTPYNIQDSNNQPLRLGSASTHIATWHHAPKDMDRQLLLHMILFSCNMCP